MAKHVNRIEPTARSKTERFGVLVICEDNVMRGKGTSVPWGLTAGPTVSRPLDGDGCEGTLPVSWSDTGVLLVISVSVRRLVDVEPVVDCVAVDSA